MITPPPAAWLDAEGDALLAFARGAATDLGFGTLDDAGTVPDPARAELWITCRMTHVFALAALRGRPGAAELADHGVAALATTFADAEHGGWFTAVEQGPAGPRPAGEAGARKEAYPHAFVLLAAASATAAGRPGAAELLARACAVSTERFWDDEAGAVRESFDRTFTAPEDYRGANANMHTVEAYLAVADVTGEDVWLDRALRITCRLIDGEARAHGWRLPEHFTPGWRPLLEYNRDQPAHPFRPFGATVGHWLEWARLTLELRAALAARGRDPEPWTLEAPRALVETAAREGWAVDGADGFVYTVDFAGSPVVRQRMHWVVCEGVGAAAALHAATGEEAYADWYRTWWDYARRHLIEAPGRWHHELAPDNTPAAGTWSGRPDVYHAYQATLLPRLPLTPALAPALAAGLLEK
ncbi:AGE family epimerase/isomerase [Georgenia thermotolerans]|uniref:AGE family epimerase/isomerase n=1 Tax=Georgenia thermotolerans TaxID=527326 RepID=A0A7J5ULR1_9MICO|nr:AGE family epimerase/isomerase [Georgenia thermotolerans]KAE8763220.1 AGE family epimerase/isomerase [Georgenia thermotolerans]